VALRDLHDVSLAPLRIQEGPLHGSQLEHVARDDLKENSEIMEWNVNRQWLIVLVADYFVPQFLQKIAQEFKVAHQTNPGCDVTHYGDFHSISCVQLQQSFFLSLWYAFFLPRFYSQAFVRAYRDDTADLNSVHVVSPTGHCQARSAHHCFCDQAFSLKDKVQVRRRIAGKMKKET